MVVGVDLDSRDAFGATALTAAASGGHPEAVALLLAAGADPRVSADDGRTALHAAARAACPKSVEALLKAGAAEAFDASVRRESSGKDAGSSISENSDNDSLRTPLHEAAAGGGAPGTSERAGEVTALLLEAVVASSSSCRPSSSSGGGDDDAKAKAESSSKAKAASAPDRFGRTPLHEALSSGALHCASALAAAGADLRAMAWDGGNALHAGAAAGKGAALEACLEAAVASSSSSSSCSSSSSAIAAALRARDASGKTPLEAATAAGKAETVAVLKRFEELVAS